MKKKLEITAQEELNSNLLQAIFKNDVSEVKNLLKKGADPNSGDSFMTATERAVKRESYGIARLLIESGVNIDVKNGPNSTLLHDAIKIGGFDFARFLIGSGASVNAFNEIHQAPLFLCAENSLSEDAQEMLSVAELLLSKGAKVNALDKHKFTPLIQAAHEGNMALCQIFILAGASVDMKDKDGNSALHWAARRGHVMTCDLLIRSGALVDSMNNYGTTPFIAAAQGDHCGVIELLKASDANLFQKTREGKTALHFSVSKGYEKASLLLLNTFFSMCPSSSPDHFLDCPDSRGKKPLNLAAQHGCVAVCKILLDRGANPNGLDRENATPLHAAAGSSVGSAGSDHAGVCRLLIERGALIESKNFKGETPLHAAAISGTEQSFAALIMHGADFTAKAGPAGTMSAAGLAGKHKRKEMAQHIKALVQCKQAERAIEEVMLLGRHKPAVF